MNIRPASPADAAAIAAIYNHYILNTTISFEEAPVDAGEMQARIAGVQAGGLPWLVAAEGEQVLGYAYATTGRVRHAYRFSVERSVYLAREAAGQGLGTALYAALLDQLREAGVHLVIGGIAQPNAASVALHEKMGYVKAAMFTEVGFKFDRWIDVGYWQRNLEPREPARGA